jgi:cell division protein FtsL
MAPIVSTATTTATTTAPPAPPAPGARPAGRRRRLGDIDLPTNVHTNLRGRRGVGVWAFLLALVTAGALAHVAVRMRGIQIAYDLGRERRINTELEEQRRRLNIEIGMLKDPHRVISIARDELHMGPPPPANVVRLAPGVVLAPPPPAEPPPPTTAKTK